MPKSWVLRVMVEGDFEVVIKAIKEKSLLSSNLGHILKDIHALSCSFSSDEAERFTSEVHDPYARTTGA